MPCTVKIRVIQAASLPVMDRQSQSADTFVAVTFGESRRHETKVAKRSLFPRWDQDFRIEIADDAELQDEPVIFTVWDKDTYSSDDSIGSVSIDLNPLLSNLGGLNKISGWFPLYDTINGIRGQLRLSVKLQFFGDVNPFKETSAGLSLSNVSVLHGYTITAIHGFVEELIVERDPEYHWVDSFRASRTSNEARQLLFNQLAARVRRNIGRKAIELGGNAVLACDVKLDLEGENGVVTRATGTAVTIQRTRADEPSRTLTADNDGGDTNANNAAGNTSTDAINNNTGTDTVTDGEERKESAVTPRASIQEANTVPITTLNTNIQSQSSRSYRRDLHLITLSSFPPSLQLQAGGMVVTHAVKLLPNDSRTSLTNTRHHDQWWNEVRHEIKSHARSLNCTQIVGYREDCTINGDICLLTAHGTAVRGGWHQSLPLLSLPAYSAFKIHRRAQAPCAFAHVPYARLSSPMKMQLVPCGYCNKRFVPEILLSTMEINGFTNSGDDSINDSEDTDSTTVSEDPPIGLPVLMLGKGRFIESRICRPKKRQNGELSALALSDSLPFLEYDCHRQLIYKLRMLGMNAVFGLRLSYIVGDDMLIGTMSGTAVYSPCLPLPPPLSIRRFISVDDDNDRTLVRLQRQLMSMSEEARNEWSRMLKKWKRKQRELRRSRKKVMAVNLLVSSSNSLLLTPPMKKRGEKRIKDKYHVSDESKEVATSHATNDSNSASTAATTAGSSTANGNSPTAPNTANDESSSDSSSSDDEALTAVPSKPEFILQIDDEVDEDLMRSILDPSFPIGMECVSTETVPSSNDSDRVNAGSGIQMIAIIKRVEIKHEESLNNTGSDKQSVTPESLTPAAASQTRRLSSMFSRKDSTPATIATPVNASLTMPSTLPASSSRAGFSLNSMLASMFHDLHASLVLHALPFTDCAITGVRSMIYLPEPGVVDVVLTAQLIKRIDRTSIDSMDFNDSSSSSGLSSSSSDDDNDEPVMAVNESPYRSALNNDPRRRKARRQKRERERERLRDAKRVIDTIDSLPADSTPATIAPISRSKKTVPKKTSVGQWLLPHLTAQAAAQMRLRAHQFFQSINSLSPDTQMMGGRNAMERNASSNDDNETALLTSKRAAVLDVLMRQSQPSPRLTPHLQPQQFASSVGPNTGIAPQQLRPSFNGVELTPLSSVCGGVVLAYLGHIRVHLIKEVWNYGGVAGLGMFAHRLVAEAQSMARAHVESRGGNAAVGVKFEELRVIESNKTQAYAVIAISAEAVRVRKR